MRESPDRAGPYFADDVSAEFRGWVFGGKDNCMIMPGECRDTVPAGELGGHSYPGHLRVGDADRYFDELKSKGVEVSSAISDKPWGMREFGLRTPEGHRSTAGRWIGGAPQ